MNRDFKINGLTILYFAIAFILLMAEYWKSTSLLSVFKPLLIPSLMMLYLVTSKNKCYWYVAALFFAFCSNVFLLFIDNPKLLFYGIMAFLFYRIASIITIVKKGDEIVLLPLVLATVPFLFIFSYLIYVMVNPSNPNFYPTIINDIIISIFSGLGLSNYVMNDNKQNSWLIISTLLFTFLVILFMVENFYIPNEVFKPLSAVVFSLAHYAFYLFVIESENHTTIDLP
ncbi:lysoplasmalogenase family protein [Flavobacterium sp.]|uniref:lysoplasmalogenase family protein n=1 Tax=Flavobacterium sp. TaxID=239 RepID=UPI00286A5A87|nr:lysoplasmalogenase family protein [Flavobacterium sp.]